MTLKIIRLIGRLLRSATFLLWLCAALAFSTLSATVWAVQAGSTAAVATAKMAQMAATHRKDMRRALAKSRAKARLKRGMTALPFIGLGAVGYFEEQEYRAWLKENPEGDRMAYACESAELTAEVLDEVLQSLPEKLRPGEEALGDLLPACDAGAAGAAGP